MPIYLPQNLLNELIVDNHLSFHLWRLVLSEVQLSHSRLNEVRLSRSKLSELRLSHSRLSEVRSSRSKLSELRLSHLRLSKVRLSRSKLSELRLSHSRLSEVRLSRSKLSELRLSHSNVMFYRGKAHEIEWKQFFQLVGSSPRQSSLGIATSQLTHSQWTIGSAASCSLYIELSSLISLLKIHLRRMQQPTEIWKKACHWRIRHCCLRQMQQLLKCRSRLVSFDLRVRYDWLTLLSIVGWFANRFATWFIRWIAHWLLKSNQMIDPNLISNNWAQTCECMCITSWMKACQ